MNKIPNSQLYDSSEIKAIKSQCAQCMSNKQCLQNEK